MLLLQDLYRLNFFAFSMSRTDDITAQNVSVFGAIQVRIFPHLDYVYLRIQSECAKM